MKRSIFHIVSTGILLALSIASCQKEGTNTPVTPEEEPMDYSIQVIPSIQEIFANHTDLIKVMDTLLHFGDNPPQLSKLIVDTSENHRDTLLGFCNNFLELKKYLKSDTTTIYQPSEMIQGTYQFLFPDQHKGVSSLYFRSTNHDNGPNDHYIETATRHDSVFIMGEKPFFTVYFFQKLKKDLVVPGYHPQDIGAKEAVILSGEVVKDGVNEGIKNLYIGIKVYDYKDPSSAGIGGFNIGDIVVYYKDFMPFTYWDPQQTYSH